MLYRSTGAVDERDRALALARRAVELDPQSFIVRARAAATDYEIGPGTEAQRRTRATRDLEVALRLNPWSAQVLGMLHDLAVQGHDDAAAARWAHKLCEMNLCPEPVPEDPAGN
jgi:Tfp pilus assembly protein PilF